MSQFMPLEILLGFGLFIYRAGEQVLEATSSIKISNLGKTFLIENKFWTKWGNLASLKIANSASFLPEGLSLCPLHNY
jgi:hypothetical protein